MISIAMRRTHVRSSSDFFARAYRRAVTVRSRQRDENSVAPKLANSTGDFLRRLRLAAATHCVVALFLIATGTNDVSVAELWRASSSAYASWGIGNAGERICPTIDTELAMENTEHRHQIRRKQSRI